MAEFKKPYDKAYGFWHVTTEGDCEGRSITDLGVFEGNIDTIALALADRCYYYTLYFTAVDPTAYDKAPKKDEINISIYGASGMYDMTKEERLDAMRNIVMDDGAMYLIRVTTKNNVESTITGSARRQTPPTISIWALPIPSDG